MTTAMRQEIDEIPEAAARLLDVSARSLDAAGARMKAVDPAVLVTVARGSSDHAAYFLKYAVELQMGIPVASLGPSLASIYDAPLKLDRAASISISQSGASPDIVAMTQAAKAGGAYAVALVNTLPSKLAEAASAAIDIAAGPEIAVAATKSYVNSIVAGLAMLAAWSGDKALQRAVKALPEDLNRALALDWSEVVETLADATSLYVLGRGPVLAIAAEAALKCKETCELHAEAYSSAEVLHGPVSLVAKDFPIIAFAARDKAEASTAEIASRMAAKNARIFTTSARASGGKILPFVETGHPLTDALALIVPYYGMVEALSRRRGFNPDKPAALSKVTQTR
ncbi:SIS domain-containing protein [Rhizobium halophytocola]|uniref:SIS domain-containing protein n=1 Tax=Rhizobium halophytocola TaxID=735519 RepID=UPI001AE55AD8